MALTNDELRELTRLALTGFRGSQDIYTGLGWTANKEYLVYDAGTELVRYSGSSRTPYNKMQDGWAICCVITNAGPVYNTQWTGPLLISTVQENVRYTVGGVARLEANQFAYAELIWTLNQDYWNAPLWGGGDQIPVTDYPVFDATGYPITSSDMTQIALAVMQAAGVRRVR